MKRISLSDIPKDYQYYRSHLNIFTKFYIRNYPKSYILIQEKEGCGYIIHFFGGLFSIAIFEKSDLFPSRTLLLKYGMKRGIILWSGFHVIRPLGTHWLSFGYIFSLKYHHSTRSAFSVLDTQEYWKKWNPNARGHRNKILKEIQSNSIRVDKNASWEDFRNIYLNTRVPHSHKRFFIIRQDYFMKNYPDNFRIFISYRDNIPLAGAIFLDDHPTSSYLIAFQHPDAKKSHLGLAIIDEWFRDSQDKGYKYLDFDHMQDILDPPSYAGYTKFKSEIADYDIRFPRVWMKIYF